MSAPIVVADTSAWNRSNLQREIADRFADLIGGGQLACCDPVRLELLYSARDPQDYVRLATEIDSLPCFRLTPLAGRRAAAVQAELATSSQHRGPRPIDLYIAAIAELNNATLLHYDRHFDLIAAVTGQPAEWLAPRGTLD